MNRWQECQGQGVSWDKDVGVGYVKCEQARHAMLSSMVHMDNQKVHVQGNDGRCHTKVHMDGTESVKFNSRAAVYC